MLNVNLYLKELKSYRKSLIIWTFIVCSLTLMVMAIFPYIGGVISAKAEMMENLPEGITKAMSLDPSSWNTILGLYVVYYPIYIIVLMGVFVGSSGATIISKEEKDKTAEFLLTKPISRATIFFTKMTSVFTLTFLIFSIQTIVSYIGVKTFGEATANISLYSVMHVNGLMLLMFFTSIGVFVSMLLPPRNNFMGLIVGVVFGSYFLDAISKVSENISWIGYFSPYHYFNFQISNPNYSIEFLNIFGMICLCIGLLFVSFKIYNKKDISA